MSVSKLTIVAQLRDELTVPLRKVIKGLDEASAAAAKGAVSADRQADAFNRLAKEAGWATNKAGKWVDSSNRIVSRADRARMGIDALSLATHESAEATRRQEQAFKDVVKAAGYKIAADGSVRNALGLFVKQQTVATMRTMAAAEATKRATSAGKDYGDEAVKQARFTRIMNEAYALNIKSLGYTYNAQGKLVNVLGRTISRTEIAEHRASAAAYATQQLADAANKTGFFTQRAGEETEKFSAKAVNAANSVERLGKRFGMSDAAARRMGVSLGESINSGAVSRGVAAFKRNLDSIYEHAKTTADKINSVMGKGLMVAGGAGVLGAGYAIKGGMERLNALEQADVKLEVQKFTPEQRGAIKNEVDQMVRGTTLTLPQALDTAQGLLGSGVEYGPEFTEYMSTMVDAQSIYSAHDPKQLELVMRQIESKEILTGEERNQLAELGMPVNEWIAQEMGVEQSEVMDLIEDKQVTSDIWWKAMGKGVENGAELMGKTFTGAWLNFLAAVKRSGQFFDEPMLEPMRRGLNLMTKILDDNQEYFTKLGKAASVGMSEAVDTLPKLLAALEPLGPSIIRLVDALAPILPQITQGFIAWIDAISPLLIALIDLTAILLELVGPILPALIPLLLGALTLFQGYRIVKTVTGWLGGFFAVNAAGTTTLTGTTVAMNLLSGAATVLSRSIMMFPGTWLVAAIILVVGMLGMLYDNVEWVRKGFDAVADTIKGIIDLFDDLIGRADAWLSKKLGIDDGGSMSDMEPYIDVRPEWWQNATRPLEEKLGVGAAWGSGEGLLRFMHGSDSRDEEGNPIGTDPLPEHSYGDALTQLDNKLTPLPGPADQSVPGLADGGWTSPGTVNVGERGREFVTSAWASNQVETNAPGAMQYINDTGQLPPTGGVNVQAEVNIHGVNDPEEIRAIVMAAIREAALEAERDYMSMSPRGAA